MIDPQALGLETFKVSGDEVQVICPFHDDHLPSASFNIKKGVMYCYACGISMYARQLADELGGHVYKLKDASLLNQVRDEREWRQFLHAPLAIDHPYLMKRKVTNDQIKKHQIKKLHNGIAIPLIKRGQTCGVLVRRTLRERGVPRYIHYGEKPPVFPFGDQFRLQRYPLLVEGVFAYLRAELFGIKTFANLGANPSFGNLRYFNGRKPTILFDPDFAGYVGAAKFILYTGGSAIIPGREVDRAPSAAALGSVISNSERTSDISRLARYSGDVRKFTAHVAKWHQKNDYINNRHG
jgi:hypothetical protein